MASLAVQYNNPTCIKNNPLDRWRGAPREDTRGHAIFTDIRWCVRATLVSLRAKEENRKCTIRQLMRDWAPASDTVGSIRGNPQNRPDRYARFVARRVGIGVDEAYDIFEDATGAVRTAAVPVLAAIWRAIEYMESGGQMRSPTSELLLGAAHYYQDRVEVAA